jgi:LCP family protein required for cell wall assembly
MKRKWMMVSLVGMVILAILGYGGYTLYQITHPQNLFQPVEAQKTPPRTNEPITETAPPVMEEDIPRFGQDKVNILLLGLDKNKKREDKYRIFRTDTIILASIDFNQKKAHMISIPRDSYVEVAGRRGKDRINTCLYYGYQEGGEEGQFKNAMETVSRFFGDVAVDYYVGIDMDLVIKVIDRMGGLWYNVDVAGPANNPPTRWIQRGYQMLDGQQVLDYARFRKTSNGDIDRVERQQRLLMAIFEKAKSVEQLKNLPGLFNDFREHIYTNLSLQQIAALGYFAMGLEKEDIIMHKVEGYFLTINDKSLWGINQLARKEMVKELFGIDIPLEPNDQPPRPTPTPTPVPTPTPTPTPTPLEEPTEEPSTTTEPPASSPEPTGEPTDDPSPPPEETKSPAPTPTATPKSTPTPTQPEGKVDSGKQSTDA